MLAVLLELTTCNRARTHSRIFDMLSIYQRDETEEFDIRFTEESEITDKSLTGPNRTGSLMP